MDQDHIIKDLQHKRIWKKITHRNTDEAQQVTISGDRFKLLSFAPPRTNSCLLNGYRVIDTAERVWVPCVPYRIIHIVPQSPR